MDLASSSLTPPRAGSVTAVGFLTPQMAQILRQPWFVPAPLTPQLTQVLWQPWVSLPLLVLACSSLRRRDEAQHLPEASVSSCVYGS